MALEFGIFDHVDRHDQPLKDFYEDRLKLIETYEHADKMFAESLAVILQALTTKRVDFAGEFFRYRNVPFEVECYQKPHPPLWYGVVNADSAERAAKAGMNFISNSTAALVKAKVARYTSV